MDEADCKQSAKFRNTLTRHRRTCAGSPRGHAIGRAENKLCTERTQIRLTESYVAATSTKGQVAPVSGGSEFIGRHPTFGTGNSLVAIERYQAFESATAATLKINRCQQRCADHADPQ